MPRHKETGKWIAPEYREQSQKHNPDDVTNNTLRTEYDALEVTYKTHRGTHKTIRGNDPRHPGVMQNDDVEGVVFGRETTYVLTPDGELRTAPYKDNGRTIADADDIREITGIEFPSSAPVVGAMQEGVEATIYYRSNYSGNIKTLRMNVTSYEGTANDALLYGDEVGGDRRIEASSGRERTVKNDGLNGRDLGRAVRIEFPEGHQWTVELKNLSDDRADWLNKNDIIKKGLEKKITTSRTTENDVEIEVSHEGRIDE